MKHIFVLNPVAGDCAVETQLIPAVKRAVTERNLDAVIHVTTGKGDAESYARMTCEKLRKSGYTDEVRFYAGGGDGTLGEVAGGVLGEENVSVACLPFGTGNDFVRFFRNFADFLNLDAQLDAKTVRIDLLKVNGKVCVNACNMGFDALVAHNVTVMKRKLKLKGHAAYYASVLYCLFKKLGNRFYITVDGGEAVTGTFLLAAACNGICYGGGFKSAPSARPDDGLIDLCAVRILPRTRIARLVNLYKAGKHLEEPSLQDKLVYRRCHHITVRSDAAFVMARDGETEWTNSVGIELLPKALVFCLPKESIPYKG